MAWLMASIVWGHHTVVGRHDQHDDVGGARPSGPHRRERLVAWSVDERERPVIALDLIGADVLRDAACLSVDHVRVADPIQQQRLAVVHMAHDGDHRRPQRSHAGVIVDLDPEKLAEFGLLLLTGVDETDLGSDLGREQLHHLVTERLGGGHHLAVLHQETNHVGGGAIELGTEVLSGRGPLHNDNALRHRGVARACTSGRPWVAVPHGPDACGSCDGAGGAERHRDRPCLRGGPEVRERRDGGRRASEDHLPVRRGEDLPADRPEGGGPMGGRLRRPAGAPARLHPRSSECPGGRTGGYGEAEAEAGSACPTGETGGVPDLRGRGGAVPVCIL